MISTRAMLRVGRLAAAAKPFAGDATNQGRRRTPEPQPAASLEEQHVPPCIEERCASKFAEAMRPQGSSMFRGLALSHRILQSPPGPPH